MNPSKIVIKKCDSYDRDLVAAALNECLALLGGMAAFVKPGARVLIKPNMLGGWPPEKAVATHPEIVRAVIKMVQAAGGHPLVGDSPGIVSMARAAAGSGIQAVVEECGAQWADFETPRVFDAPQCTVTRKLTLVEAVAQADCIITLPKLKTHGQLVFTGAIKNQFGLIPGVQKSNWHFRLQEAAWLAELLLDIDLVTKPVLAIMDGVVAMEGSGPSGGDPRPMKVVLASRDLVAVDTLACLLIGQNLEEVPTVTVARRRQHGATRLEELEIIGDNWQALRQPDFRKISQAVPLERLIPMPRAVRKWIRRQWTKRPRIIAETCVQCGICEEGCPVKPSAIRPQLPGPEQVVDDQCIRCYCCHEFCPEKAIRLERGWLGRIFLD